MTTSDQIPVADEDRKRGLLVGLLGGLLALGTIVGVTQTIGNSSADRVPASSTAPVYGTP